MSSSLLQRLKHRLRSEANTSSTAPAAPARRNVAVKRLVAEPWYVDRIDISGDCLSAAGWSMPIDLEDKPADGWFTVNGRPFDELRYPLPRPDVGEVFWMREGAGQSGFEGSIGNMTDPYPGGVLEIRRVNPRTPAIEIGRDSWFKPDPARHMDLPDAERRFRVIGDRDPNGFLISGATDYHRIDRVVAQMSGRHLHEFAHVLDWGVGCGRLARHFPRSHAGALTGCDIDRDNVAWCGSHLAGRFVDCNMSPPLPFEAASFELIYSVSVFTHLREPMQMKWLEELERVMRPHNRPRPDRNRFLAQRSRGIPAAVRRSPRQRNRLFGAEHAARRTRRSRRGIRERVSRRRLCAPDLGPLLRNRAHPAGLHHSS
jgi:hypothetical protein